MPPKDELEQAIAQLAMDRLNWADRQPDKRWVAFFERFNTTEEAREHYRKITLGELTPWEPVKR